MPTYVHFCFRDWLWLGIILGEVQAWAPISSPRAASYKSGKLVRRSEAVLDAGSAGQSLLIDDAMRAVAKKDLLGLLGRAEKHDPVIACPVTLRPLKQSTKLMTPWATISSWNSDAYEYPVRDDYVDLVPRARAGSPSQYSSRQDLFRSPIVSWLYERGWRQQFAKSGFPGIVKEIRELLLPFAAPLFERRSDVIVLDLSCGSGLATRQLAASRRFSRIIAADYSESMLRETSWRLQRKKVQPRPDLIRADAAQLPIGTETLDLIHAGAALHCWPRLEDSLREVYRVLKPGGRFFASTFELGAMGTSQARTTTFRFFQKEELKQLCIDAGFRAEDVEVRREGRKCLIAQCVKQL